MKKPIALFSYAILIASILLVQGSCKHEIAYSCDANPIKLTLTKTDASPTTDDGTITASTGGLADIMYSLNGGSYSEDSIFKDLSPFKEYNIVAKNKWGCTDTAQISIDVNDPCKGVTVGISATKVDASPNQSNGSISAAATGATGFTYSLNNGAYQASGTFSNLAAGDYVIAAKSAAGCSGVTQITIGTNDPCAGVTVAVATTNVDPTGTQSNGSITASATGGTGFTYSINNGAFQSSGAFTGLAAGSYTITAKNADGCSGVKQVSLASVDPCAGVTVTVTTTTVDPTGTQSNGSITASATGGTGFTYSINNGAFQSSGTFTGLATGNYTITAKNSNGCLGVKQVALGSNNPCAGVTVSVTASAIVNPASGQSNGSITVAASGGTGFTYSINNGAFQNSGSFTGLAAGTYTITAKNSNGCLGSVQVTLTSSDPCAGITVVVTTTSADPSSGQSNGSITASATGGTGFTYSINNGAYQNSGSFTGLAAGTYTITAKNSNGCLGTKQVTLTASSSCPNISLTGTTADVVPCVTPANNGSITLSASGSSGYTYNINGGAYQAGNVFSGLAAGNYVMGVKDANGCTKTTTITLSVKPRGPLFAAARTVLFTKCGPCHINGGSTKGVNYDNDCNIVSGWSKINSTAAAGNSMPPSGSPALTAAEKQALKDWIAAGHTYDK